MSKLHTIFFTENCAFVLEKSVLPIHCSVFPSVSKLPFKNGHTSYSVGQHVMICAGLKFTPKIRFSFGKVCLKFIFSKTKTFFSINFCN